MKIIIGTNNAGKLKEIIDLLPKKLRIYSPKDLKLKSPVETGKSFKDLFSSDVMESAEFNLPILAAFIFAFFIGLFCCKWMIQIVDQSKLKHFGIYCFIGSSPFNL